MKKAALGPGGLLALALGVQGAAAQTQAPAKGDPQDAGATVVVTGTRQSLAQAVDLKRQSVQFVDVVVADDIGKLPDINVAESLSRVSGVQLQQGIGGEGAAVTIRGSRDNVTLFNGRQVIDVAGRGGQGLDTLGTASYGILSIIPAELVGRLEVTKLPGADEIEGALGGVVNIVSRKPLDLRKRLIAGAVESSYRDFGGDFGKRASLLYADVNAPKTFGMLVNLNLSRTNIREDNFSSFLGYQPLTAGFNTNNKTGVRADNNGDGVLGSRIADLRYQTLDDRRERNGATVSLQWKPQPDLSVFADLSYMNTESSRDRHWLAIPVSGSGLDWLAVTMTPDDYIVGGTQTTRLTTSYEYVDLKTDLMTSAIGANWRRGDLRVSGEVDYSRSRGQMNQWAGVLTTVNKQAVSFDYQGGEIPSVSIPALNFSDPAQFIWTNAQENRRPSLARDVAARADLTYSLDGFGLTSVQAGWRGSETYYETQPSNNSVSSTAGVTTPGFNTPATLTPNLLGVFSQGDFVPGATVPNTFLVPTKAIVEQGCRSFSAYYNATQAALCTPTVVTPLSASTVEERINALYLKANFETSLFGHPLEGNVGARYVQTKLESLGYTRYVKGGVSSFSPNSVSNKRKDFLPSAVLKWSLPSGLVLRAGAARAIARPATSRLTSALTINESVSASGDVVFSASGGAPKLKPYEVNQYDLSAEYYFGKKDLVSLGLFYKDVNTYFINQTRPEVIPGVANDQPINVTRTVNGEGATIRGQEVILQKGFDFLPKPFDGFGTQITYSHIDSETPTIDPTTGENLPLPGLSRNNLNAVLYYETARWGVRMAYNVRQSFFDSIGANGAGVFYDGYKSLAMSSFVNINRNWKLTLAASNLGSEPLRIYAGKPQYIKQLSIAEPIVNLSLSARF